MTLGALVGSRRQWQTAEPELLKLQKRFDLKEFRGSYIAGLVAQGIWTEQRHYDFMTEFNKKTRRLIVRPLVSMDIADYMEIFPSNSERNETRPDYSELGVCFTFLLDLILTQTLQRRPRAKPVFHLVMEDMQGAGVTETLWDSFREKRIPPSLQTPHHTFERQGKGSICLGAADIFAWFTRKVVSTPSTYEILESSEQKWEPGQAVSLELTKELIQKLRNGQIIQDIGRTLS